MTTSTVSQLAAALRSALRFAASRSAITSEQEQGILAAWNTRAVPTGGDTGAPTTAPVDQVRLREALDWFRRNAEGLKSDVLLAHRSRGNGCTEWMREDDRDFRKDLDKHLAALSPTNATSEDTGASDAAERALEAAAKVARNLHDATARGGDLAKGYKLACLDAEREIRAIDPRTITEASSPSSGEGRCAHGIRHPWQCDDCDRENPMPEGWTP